MKRNMTMNMKMNNLMLSKENMSSNLKILALKYYIQIIIFI